MNRTVYRYQLELDRDFVVALDNPWLVHVGPNPTAPPGASPPNVWVEHGDLDTPYRDHLEGRVTLTFRFVGTGHPVPDGMGHVGSTVIGPFCWHVYMRYDR